MGRPTPVRHSKRRGPPPTHLFKYLFILAIGIAIGYSYGWKDAQVNTTHIAERLVERIGGDNKKNMDADIDAKMRSAEKK